MSIPTFLEILQDAAVELENVVKALRNQDRRRFFTADAARAECDDGLVLQRRIESIGRLGELAEGAQAQIHGIVEGSRIHLEGVARIEQHDLPAFVEPALEFRRRDSGCSLPCRIDAGNAQRDNFHFDLDDHAVERLERGQAAFETQVGESAIGTQRSLETYDSFLAAGNDDVDAFETQQDGALERKLPAAPLKQDFQVVQSVQRNELIAGEVDELHERRAGGSGGLIMYFTNLIQPLTAKARR